MTPPRRRGAARPAQTGRPRRPVAGRVGEPATKPAGRAANLTGRAAVLALVFCMLAISLAYPLREYLAQRGEIGDYRAKVTAQQQRVAQLEETQRRWQDPAYVKAQARARLHFVLPGEVQYVVLEPDEAPVPAAPLPPGRARPAPERPWYTDLWHSVEVAGTS